MSSSRELPSLFGRFTAILKDHDHLGTTMRHLRVMCAALDAEQEALPPELAPERLCAKLRAELSAHFGAEESLDYFGVVVDEAPSLAARIGSLKQEHTAMLCTADVLCRLAQERGDWRLLADSTRKLVGELERHERSESTLLRTLFFPKS
jgi:hypothetical protein